MEQNTNPNWKSSQNVMMLLVVLLCILLGFCGFLCYKMISSSPSTKEPPLIKPPVDSIHRVTTPDVVNDSVIDTIPEMVQTPPDTIVKKPASESLELKGKVGPSDVEMILYFHGNHVKGHYSYYKTGTPITLTGEINENNHIIMDEISYNNGIKENSGQFEGDLVSNVFKGRFHNQRKNKDYYFELFVR